MQTMTHLPPNAKTEHLSAAILFFMYCTRAAKSAKAWSMLRKPIFFKEKESLPKGSDFP